MSDYVTQMRARIGHDLLILPSAAAIILDEQDRLLLGKHRGLDKWVTPGGMVEPGEHPADAARREAWEETGLLVKPVEILAVQGGPLFVVEYKHGDRAAYTSTWFRCEILGGKLQGSNSEMAALRFFSRDEVEAEEGLMPWLKANLDIVFSSRGAAHFEPATWQPIN